MPVMMTVTLASWMMAFSGMDVFQMKWPNLLRRLADMLRAEQCGSGVHGERPWCITICSFCVCAGTPLQCS